MTMMQSFSTLCTFLTDWRYYPRLAALVLIFELLLGVAILTFARGTFYFTFDPFYPPHSIHHSPRILS